jgi:hypothetical protein
MQCHCPLRRSLLLLLLLLLLLQQLVLLAQVKAWNHAVVAVG